MAKTYTSKIPLRVWKEHTCVGCGAVYSYELIRSISGTGGTPDKAKANAEKAAQKAINTATDLQPCPTCGLYQPDMIGQRRGQSNTALLVIALIGFVVVLGLRGGDILKAETATWVSVISCGVVALILWLGDLKNLNSDTEANRQLAAPLVTGGKLRHLPGDTHARVDEWARRPRSAMHLGALVLLLAAVAVVAAPELIRGSHRWPLNNECYPPVLGPGDSTRIYMPDSITSIKSYWRAKAKASMRDANNKSGPEVDVPTTTNQNTWGDHISFKSSEKYSTSHPWAELTLPNDASLANKVVTCNIKLNVQYPQSVGSGVFETKAEKMNHALTIRLGPAGSGAQYNSMWWTATAGGMVLTLICNFLLIGQAKALVRTAKPTRTIP